MISALNNWASLEHTLDTTNKLLDFLKKTFKEKPFISEHIRSTSTNFILNNTKEEKLIEICFNYMNTFVKNAFVENTTNNNNDLFLKTTFDINIGHKIVQEFLKDKLLRFCAQKTSEETYKIFTNIVNCYMTNKFDNPYFEDILKLANFNIKNPEIRILIILLIKYLVKNNLWNATELRVDKHHIEHLFYKEESIKYLSYLGVTVGEALMSHDIIEYAEKEDLIGFKNIKRYKFKHAIKTLLYASATFSKPYIWPHQAIQDNIFTKDNLDVTLNIRENTQEIRESYHTKIVINDAVENLIDFASTMQYKVFEQPFSDLIEYLGGFKSLYNDTTEEEKALIILLLYKIDINILKKNNPDQSLVKKVIEVALKINEKFDIKELQKLSIGNLAIYTAFNNIDASKMALKGLFNDLNIYKHFNFFYLGKHATSSGRIFISSFFISLQGNKIAEAFIINYKNSNVIDYDKLKILTKTNFDKDLPNTLQEFKAHNKQLFRKYIEDKLIPNTNIESFPWVLDFAIQIKFLINHCKKTKEIFLTRSMIIAYLSDTWEDMFYGKDATSSGTQIMALIKRLPALAKLCNVSGNSKTDLYMMFGDPLTEEVTKIKDYIHDFVKQYVKIPLQEVLDYKSYFLNKEIKKVYNKNVTKQGKKLNDILYKNDIKIKKQDNLVDNTLSMENLLLEILHSNNSKQTLELINTFTNKLKRDKIHPYNTLYHIPKLITCWKSFNNTKINLTNNLLTLNKYFTVYKGTREDILPTSQLRDRQMFKKHAMTRPYSAGNHANIENFQEYLKEKAIEQGLARLNPILLHITPIILNEFFNYYAQILLHDMDTFLDLCRSVIEEHCITNKDSIKPLTIVFPYLSWNFLIYKRNQKRLNLSKTLRPTLQLEEREFNTTQMKIKFPSIFIQGIDAQIVYSFIEHAQTFHENSFPLSIWSNHDCFHIAAEYAMLLDIILQNIYTNLSSDATFIKNLYLNKQEFEAFLRDNPPIICTNPYFIKH